MLTFDARLAAHLERVYRGRDFVRRRQANIEALAPRAGERLLDVGCGTGLMVAELAAAVGPDGHVTGVDPSRDMRASAALALDGTANADIREGSAERLPLDDASVDGIASLQVFEYIPDPRPALAECRRVLAPGGRIVIGDMHFGTLAWHSDDPERMARMIAAYDGHFANGAVPATILGHLSAAGFRHRASIAVEFTDTGPRPDGIARMTQLLMADFARSSGAVPEDEVRAWSDELDRLAAEGRHFFSITHVITVADAV